MNESNLEPDKGAKEKAIELPKEGAAARPREGQEQLKPFSNVPLQLSIELGKTSLKIRDLLEIKYHSIYQLDEVAGGHLNIHVNGILLGRGEPLIAEEKVCIRINEIVDQSY
jgi:flagellar motor switch protein FliN/FliY